MVVNSRDRAMGKAEMGKGKGEKADKAKENTFLMNWTTQLFSLKAQFQLTNNY
ncbi:MAG: hypothetical protein HC903_21360 [Methylacidiphilales bacterium]|nr:hypothetical protein [Candidatus Methylacidiphilales bacterium]NJR17183.1 hypothetical protein [Calothrix sp. CSU_2_0]